MIFGEIDSAFTLALQSTGAEFEIFFRAISFLGNPVVWLFIASLIYWSGREKKSIFAFNLILLTSATVALLKVLFAVPRPNASKFKVVDEGILPKEFSYEGPINYSFPSGHSTMASAMATHFRKFAKGIGILAIAALPIAVAFSRIYLGKHFLSDVIAGLILGVMLAVANEKLSSRLEKVEFSLGKLSNEVIAAMIALLAVIAVVYIDVPLMATGMLGFYAGFFVSRAAGMNQEKVKGKNLLLKLLAGSFSLALVAALAVEMPAVASAILFFAGAWVSLGYPLLWERLALKH